MGAEELDTASDFTGSCEEDAEDYCIDEGSHACYVKPHMSYAKKSSSAARQQQHQDKPYEAPPRCPKVSAASHMRTSER